MRSFQAVLAATLPIAEDGRAQLLPAGDFKARDGRPGPGKTWRLDDARGTALAASLSAVAALTPVVIDYDHQTLYVQTNGQQAPAAGWIKAATWLSGQGLMADVEWTPPAKQRIADKEYQFISPVITYDDAGHVTGVAMAALCNYPAIVGMSPVLAALSTQFNPEPTGMNPTLTALMALLGITPLATEEQSQAAALAAVTALKQRPPVPVALTAALGLQGTSDEAAALAAVTALKGADTGTLAVVTDLQTQVATLRAQLNSGALATLVDGAIAAGKFAPAHRDWLMAQGTKDMAALKAAIDASPVIPGLSGQSGGQERTGAAALAAEAEAVRTAFGLSAEDFARGAPKAA